MNNKKIDKKTEASFVINKNLRNHVIPFFLVVDRKNSPMTWDGEQFVYSHRYRSRRWPAECYTESVAKELIRRTKRFRRKNDYFDREDYFLMPINFTHP